MHPVVSGLAGRLFGVALLTVAVVGCSAAGVGQGPQPLTAQITVEAGDLYFSPSQLAVPAAGQVTIALVDTGRIPHNLTVDELGIQVVAPAGRTGEALLSDLAPGTYDFYCSISGHREAGMVGTLTVS